MTWLLSSFNFYLITFYLKSFPGSMYVNSICFATADMFAFLFSGIALQFLPVSRALFISYTITGVGGTFYLIFQKSGIDWLVPMIVMLSRVGSSMSFNIGYISVARLFPTEYVASVFGVVNLLAHLITVGAPLVAEAGDWVPFIIFTFNSFMALFAAAQLKELGKK